MQAIPTQDYAPLPWLLDDILSRPYSPARLEFHRQRYTHGGLNKEGYDAVVQAILAAAPSLEKETLAKQAEFARDGLANSHANPNPLKFHAVTADTEAERLLWSVTLFHIADNPKEYGPVERHPAWLKVQNTYWAQNEMIKNSRHIFKSVGDKNARVQWGLPGSGFYYDMDHNTVVLDLARSMFTPEYMRIFFHEEGHRLLTQELPERLEKERQTLERLAEIEQQRKLTDSEGREAVAANTRLKNGHDFFNAMEDHAVNGYAVRRARHEHEHKPEGALLDALTMWEAGCLQKAGIALPPDPLAPEPNSAEGKYDNLIGAIIEAFKMRPVHRYAEDSGRSWQRMGVDVARLSAIGSNPGDPDLEGRNALTLLRGYANNVSEAQPAERYYDDVEALKIQAGNVMEPRYALINEAYDRFAKPLVEQMVRDNLAALDAPQPQKPQPGDQPGQPPEPKDGGNPPGQDARPGGKDQPGKNDPQPENKGDGSPQDAKPGDQGKPEGKGQPGKNDSRPENKGDGSPQDAKPGDQGKPEGREDEPKQPVNVRFRRPGEELPKPQPGQDKGPVREIIIDVPDMRPKHPPLPPVPPGAPLPKSLGELMEKADAKQPEAADHKEPVPLPPEAAAPPPLAPVSQDSVLLQPGDVNRYNRLAADRRSISNMFAQKMTAMQEAQIEEVEARAKKLGVHPGADPVDELAQAELILARNSGSMEEGYLMRFPQPEITHRPPETSFVTLLDVSSSVRPYLSQIVGMGCAVNEAANIANAKIKTVSRNVPSARRGIDFHMKTLGITTPAGSKAITLAKPGEHAEEIAQRIEGLEHDMRMRGSSLKPALDDLVADVRAIERSRGSQGRNVGMMEIVIMSDGDITDSNTSFPALKALLSAVKNVAVDFIVIDQPSHHRYRMVEKTGVDEAVRELQKNGNLRGRISVRHVALIRDARDPNEPDVAQMSPKVDEAMQSAFNEAIRRATGKLAMPASEYATQLKNAQINMNNLARTH